MKSIAVHAERSYEVIIGCDWKSEVLKMAQGRSRVAVIYSTTMRDAIRFDADVDAEFHFFEVSDGESAKSIATLSSVWNWLGAAGFTLRGYSRQLPAGHQPNAKPAIYVISDLPG